MAAGAGEAALTGDVAGALDEALAVAAPDGGADALGPPTPRRVVMPTPKASWRCLYTISIR